MLTVYKADDFNHAKNVANEILNYQGIGHSIGIHTNKNERVMKLGLDLPVWRVIVNQAHAFATGGSFNNGLPFSLSMGCGTWQKNSIDNNLNYKHFINITKIFYFFFMIFLTIVFKEIFEFWLATFYRC